MGRWSHLDTDEERLPEGMTRIGYDADTQVYTYRDTDGSHWEGAPGVQYGKLYRVRPAPALPSVRVTQSLDPRTYVLHDYDPSDSGDSDSVDSDNHTLTDEKKNHTLIDEKKNPGPSPTRTVPYPDKAVLRTSIKRKPTPTPNQPTNTTTDDADRLSLASTLVDRFGSIRSRSSSTTTTTTNPENQQPNKPGSGGGGGSGLRRTGTLTRLARFLGSSSSSAAGLVRRATVAGETGAAAAGRRRAGGGGQNGPWPGSSGSGASGQGGGNGNGNGSARAARARKRATTFEEILGE
ncbi:hypothetical protein B0I37DRAFT_369511 [Chaetomium sp. MPI-CAGE-AT-0009]|nr:hypothetical protein B0I37DRAFT_369511 [Chaetomium sp. MPI-CAGE-AT-0009]